MARRGLFWLACAAVVLSAPAQAEDRWLACKYTDTGGATRNFFMVFDDRRSTASLYEGGGLIEGTSTNVTFQAVRARFPQFVLTYNRNDGGLSIAPTAGGLGGILTGECRRSPPPQNLPQRP